MELLILIYKKILMNQIFLSLLSGLIGAWYGGKKTLEASEKAYKNNLELEKRKLQDIEKSVVLSIMEELKVLKYTYEQDMDEMFNDLIPLDVDINTTNIENKSIYIESYYTITQDFMTIYNNNADKIGLISNTNLRNKIIETYTLLKKYIEELLNYKDIFDKFISNQNIFVAKVYPSQIDRSCSSANTKANIDYIINEVKNNRWQWLNSPYINPEQVKTFLKNNFQSEYELRFLSNDLKKEYFELKKLIDDIINIVDTQY